MRNRLLALLKISVTVTLFLYIFNKIDFHQFGVTLINASIPTLFLAFLLLWVAHFICIYRWRLLMRPLMPVLSTIRLFGIYCIGLFFNLIFPTVIGGDVVKMYYAGRPHRTYAESFAATFLDRDAGMLAMMIIACAAIIFHPVKVPGIPVTIILWSIFATFLAGNIAVFTPVFHKKLIDLLRRVGLQRVATKIQVISDAFQIMGRHPLLLLGAFLISFVNQVLVISVTWITAIALHVHLSFVWFLLFVPVVTLISMIPISLNGMGLREYGFLTLFSAIGVSAEACIALGLISSLVIILSSIPGGIVYVFLRNAEDLRQLTAVKTEF